MKKLLATTLLILTLPLSALGADSYAILVFLDAETKEEDLMKVWITAASDMQVEFKTAPQALNRTRFLRSNIKSIYFFEPPVFKEATQLYEGRKYKEAREKFAICKEAFSKIKKLPGNYGTLAGYYELECCRRMMDLKSLKALRDTYIADSLVRKNQKVQMEIYPAWDAVRAGDWARLESIVSKMLDEKKWINSHLVQLKYCHGLALEAIGKPIEALIAFNGAFTADYTASSELAQTALLNCLRIIKGHEEVALAISLWGSEDEDPNSTGYLLLQEGVALCDLWKAALGGGKALPVEYVMFSKYREKNKPKAKPKKKKADDPKEKKADDPKGKATPKGKAKPEKEKK